MVPQGDAPSGSVQHPKYQVLMELGSGGMGLVHLAMARGPLGFVKLVVLKTLKAELRSNDSTRQMFHEEARISARLAHPNLVQTYEVIEHDDAPTMVLEYVEGQPLEAILEQSGRALRRDVHLTILTKALAGLHAAHELRDFDGTPLNLVHRDVSPQNVMVQYDGQVKVLDFGIAKTERSKVETAVGVLKGKIRYMPPEQLSGGAMDRRVDVFAIGIMLWEALAQARMWSDMDDGDVMRGLLNDNLPDLPADRDIPAELAEICYRAVATAPGDRYATAGEFLRDLEGYLSRTGQLCSAEQLGDYVVAQFDDERKRTQQIINSHIHAVNESICPPAPIGFEDNTVVATTTKEITGSEAIKKIVSLRISWIVAALSLLGIVLLAYYRFAIAPLERSTIAANKSATQETAPLLRCEGKTKLCYDACVAIDQPELGCGNAKCLPCQIPNATPRCNRENECDIAVCYQAFDNCDGDKRNGCEVNVRVDPDNCGGCNQKCPELPHAQRGCGDVCTIWRCHPGYHDCNGIVADGCEVASTTDEKNCGHCGVVCPVGTTCQEGKCHQ